MDFYETIFWLWKLYITYGLVFGSVVGLLILFGNTIAMSYNKEKNVQPYWIANIFSLCFYSLAILAGLILWFFPANAIQAQAVATVAKAFE